jgi:hypothetical protein
MKNIKIAISFVLSIILLNSCSIQKYTLTPIVPDSNNIFVNRLPSDIVTDYDDKLTESWIRTYNRCIQIKIAIDKEIDKRERKQNSLGKVFSGVGGATGLATAIYALAATNPSTAAIGILGIFGGTTFATSMGFIREDKIVITLKEKSNKLELLKSECEFELTKLEELISKKNLLVRTGKNDIKDNTDDPEPDPDVINFYEQIESQIIKLRVVLSRWDNEAK